MKRKRRGINKKGFTLIEIIAVVIIIALMALIAIPPVTEFILGGKKRTYETYESNMRSAAEGYMAECMASDEEICELPGLGESKKIFLDELISRGYTNELKDPEDEGVCSANSYVIVENKGKNITDIEYESCLYCSNYKPENSKCEEYSGEGAEPNCKRLSSEKSGESKIWTNGNRTVVMGCEKGGETRGSECDRSEFSKTFTKSTKVGEIVVRSEGGKTKTCNVDVYIDKEAPKCELRVKSGLIGEDGWYGGKVIVEMLSKSDTGGSELLTYGMGKSYQNREYNKKSEIEVGNGITTVFGYVKDYAGNEGICSIELKVDSTKPTVASVKPGYQIYPNKEKNEISGITVAGTQHTTTNSSPTIEIRGLTEYRKTDEVIVYFEEALTSGIQTEMRYKSSGGSYGEAVERTVGSGASKVSYIIPEGTYESIKLVMGNASGVSYKIGRIEVVTGDSSVLYTNKNVRMYIYNKDTLTGVNKYSFNSGSTWETGNTKMYEVNTSGIKIKVKDAAGNESEESIVSIGNIDKLVPSCSVSLSGVMGDNNWYRSNVVVGFESKIDATATGQYAKSEIRKAGIRGIDNPETYTHTEETTNITYTGYVEDRAGNSATCTKTFKKDGVYPVCTDSGDSTIWINTNRDIRYGCSDSNGCATGYAGGVKSFTTTTKTATMASYEIKDMAGNQTTCGTRVANVYLDVTDPVCPGLTGESTEWTAGNRTIGYGCSDTDSGCASGSSGGTKLFNTTTKIGTIDSYTIKDIAGNVKVCPIKSANVYVDKTAPTCTESGDSTVWTKENRKIYYGCNDPDSGCKAGASGGYNEYSSTTKTASIGSYVIKDNVDNSTTCVGRTANVYVDKTPPVCTAYTGESTVWTAGNRTIGYGCSDTDSGCMEGSSGGSKLFDTSTKRTTISAYTIVDNASNIVLCPAKEADVYVDKTPPECTATVGESTVWINSDRTISWGCNDLHSGCDTSFSGGSQKFTTTIKTSPLSAYTLKDKVGNSKVCPGKDLNVYVDKTPPTCTWSANTSGWSTSLALTATGSDSHSGVKEVVPSTATVDKDNAGKKTATVTDNAGNTNTCEVTANNRNEYRKRDCDTCKRCSSASCEEWNAYVYSGTCYCEWVNTNGSSSNYYTSCSSIPAYNNSGCSSYCSNQRPAALSSSGSSDCSRSRTCNLRSRSCSSCGCDDWGSWNSWGTSSYTSSSSREVQTRKSYCLTGC